MEKLYSKEWKVGAQKTGVVGGNAKVLASSALRDSPIEIEESKAHKEAVYVKHKYFTDKGAT